MEKPNPDNFRNALEDIMQEVQDHESAEELGYTLFRVKKLYEDTINLADKQKAKKLFSDIKLEVEKLLEIDIKDAEEKNDAVRVKELKELLEKVKSMNV